MLIACSVCSALATLAQSVVTSPPPAQIIFIPDAQAMRVVKHPSLPLLYLSTYREPKAINLITLGLNTDGTINTNSEKTFDFPFLANRTNTYFGYTFQRPAVLTDEKMLLLAATPSYHAQYFAESNNVEFATLALDDQGQPVKMLHKFRHSFSGYEILIQMQWE